MYRYIKGMIEEKGENFIVIEAGGIGYTINTSTYSIANADFSKEVKVYTHLNVREDDMSLFGFLTKEELELFRLLKSVSKIGPKVALGIMSTMKPSDVKRAIREGNTKLLSKCPGVGPKTAQRISLELKDKVKDDIDILESYGLVEYGNLNEAVEALIALGYSVGEVNEALKEVDTKASTEEIVKMGLMKLMQK